MSQRLILSAREVLHWREKGNPDKDKYQGLELLLNDFPRREPISLGV